MHAVLDRHQLEAGTFFKEKLDTEGAEDLDQGEFEEALVGLGMVMLDEEVAALWESILVPPSDLISAEDFAKAAEKNPPS